MTASTIRVLIADDSPTTRAMLKALFARSSEFEVVGEAQNGAEAIERAIALTPDLIIMDVNTPVVDGLDATKEIMREAPAPILMVSASASVADVSLGLSATQAGALMLLEKPSNPGSPTFEDDARQFLGMARAMAGVKVVRRWSKPRGAPRKNSVSATPTSTSSKVRWGSRAPSSCSMRSAARSASRRSTLGRRTVSAAP